jgi:hypothetical protein
MMKKFLTSVFMKGIPYFYVYTLLFLLLLVPFDLGGIENTSKMAVILGGISSVATGVIRVIKTFPHTQNFDYKF